MDAIATNIITGLVTMLITYFITTVTQRNAMTRTVDNALMIHERVYHKETIEQELSKHETSCESKQGYNKLRDDVLLMKNKG